MKDEFEYKFKLLLKEIDVLQNGIRSYDSILFTIKGWAITVFSAFVLFAAKEEQPKYLIFCGIAIVLFWALDALNKSFQRRYIIRYNKIEHFLRRREFSEAVKNRSFKGFNLPDVGARVSVKRRAKKTSALRAAFYLHTYLPYLAMLFISEALAIWLAFAK
jgi:hypothetical protein